jgi:predicted nucleic acid-binding protein
LTRRRSRAPAAGFVLDASVALAWCFHDEATSQADAMAKRLAKIGAMVPGLWRLEIANALLAAERHERCTTADTQSWLRFLSTLPIRLDDETASHAWSDTLRLARAQKLSVYDAAYLELALRRGLDLATLDSRLATAADAVGVRRFRP